MSFNVSESLREVQEEIRRLQGIERALLAASDGAPKKRGQNRTSSHVGVTDTGRRTISLANKLRWAKVRKPLDSKLVRKLESELAEATRAHEAFKAAQRG